MKYRRTAPVGAIGNVLPNARARSNIHLFGILTSHLPKVEQTEKYVYVDTYMHG